MHFVRLSDELTVNAANVLHSREDGDSSVALTFSGPGPENSHKLKLEGEEAQAWRNFVDAST
jgi:hypothetical protein